MQTVNLRMAKSGKAMNCHSQVPRRGILRMASAFGLFVLLAIVLSAAPLRAEQNVTPQVARILAEIREAPNWDWLSEHSESHLLSHDRMGRIGWENRGRPEAALQALRIAIQDEDVLIRRAAVGISSMLWQVDPRRPGISDIMVGALSDPDDLVRRDAAYELGKIGETAIAVPVLIEALGNTSPELRISAARGLREVGRESEAAMQALIGSLDDPDAGVRRQAAASLRLVGMGNEVAVRALMSAMADPNAEVRIGAISSLHTHGEAAAIAIPALSSALADPDGSVRRRAVDALGSLKELAGPAAPQLVERLLDQSEPFQTRQAAATSLSYIGLRVGHHQDLVIEGLIRALDDPEARVRNNVAYALGEFGPAASAAVPRLTEMLASDPAQRYRGMAGYALGRIGVTNAQVLSELTEAFWSEEINVAWGATNGLIGLGPDAVAAAMPTLVEIIETGSEVQRVGVLRGLREFGAVSPEALAAVSRIAEDSSRLEESRADAIRTIITMVESASNTEQVRTDALWALIRIAEDTTNSERLRADALRRMSRFGNIAVSALPALQQIHDTQDGLPKSYARGAIGALRPR